MANHDVLAGPSQYDLTYTNPNVDQGYRVDLEASKNLAPVGVSVHGGDVYGVFNLEDTDEPRPFTEEFYMNAVPSLDKLAQVKVGMSWGPDLYYATVEAGGETLVCLELSNNSGDNWSDVGVTP